MYCTLGNQAGLVVWHWECAASENAGQALGDVAAYCDAQHGPLLKSMLSGSATYYGTLIRRVFPVPLSVPAWENLLTGIGGRGGDPLPTQTCGLISWQTAKAGRKYRGRSFIPFPSETDSADPPQPSAAYRGFLSAIGAARSTPILVGAANSVRLLPVIYHRKDHTWDEILAFKIRLFWATQRRRGFLGRPNVPPF